MKYLILFGFLIFGGCQFEKKGNPQELGLDIRLNAIKRVNSVQVPKKMAGFSENLTVTNDNTDLLVLELQYKNIGNQTTIIPTPLLYWVDGGKAYQYIPESVLGADVHWSVRHMSVHLGPMNVQTRHYVFEIPKKAKDYLYFVPVAGGSNPENMTAYFSIYIE